MLLFSIANYLLVLGWKALEA